MLGHRPLTPGDYAGILKRRFLYLILPAILCSVAALGISFFIAPRFVSQTLVLIEQQKISEDYVKPVIAADLDARLASMKEQILSRSRIQPIIERFNLYPGEKMDERVDDTRKKHRHQADPFRNQPGEWPAGLFYHVHRRRSAHGAAGLQRDYVAVCGRRSPCARTIRAGHHRFS